MKNNLSILTLSVLTFCLHSCDNGGEGENGNNDDNGFDSEIVGESGILENLNTTNLDTSGFPWFYQDDVNQTGCGLSEL
ncbi:MAG TPA: hypothetical protein DCM40_10730, partial [Maribacter sp.]|nr:hypothetical protein [Maribacter sp.]